jgi:hypothetical protein
MSAIRLAKVLRKAGNGGANGESLQAHYATTGRSQSRYQTRQFDPKAPLKNYRSVLAVVA